MSPVWWLTVVISVALLLLSIEQMRRHSHLRTYPCLAGFLIGQLLMTCANVGQLMRMYNLSGAGYRQLYWTTEFATAFLLTVVMVSFIHSAIAGRADRARTMALVVLVIVAATVAAVYAGSSAKTWARQASLLARNLSFGAALLNLFLWQSLLKYRRGDFQLLVLSAGLGLLTTGRAIGQSLKLLTAENQGIGNAVVVGTELLGLCLWYWALSRPAASAGPTTLGEEPQFPEQSAEPDPPEHSPVQSHRPA